MVWQVELLEEEEILERLVYLLDLAVMSFQKVASLQIARMMAMRAFVFAGK